MFFSDILNLEKNLTRSFQINDLLTLKIFYFSSKTRDDCSNSIFATALIRRLLCWMWKQCWWWRFDILIFISFMKNEIKFISNKKLKCEQKTRISNFVEKNSFGEWVFMQNFVEKIIRSQYFFKRFYLKIMHSNKLLKLSFYINKIESIIFQLINSFASS